MTSKAKAHRRSLKECLKNILQRRRDDHDEHHDHLTVGSGILKRNHPSLALLPAFSSLSTLPDFDGSRFDVDRYSVSISDRPVSVATKVWAADYPQLVSAPHTRPRSSLSQREIHDAYEYQSQLGQLAKHCSDEQDWYSSESLRRPSRNTQDNLSLTKFDTILFPKTSLDQLITPDAIHFRSPLSQLAQACNIPSVYRHGASQQASLATLSSHARSASTLRLQPSTQELKSIQNPAPASQLNRNVATSPPAELRPLSDPGKRRLPRGKSSRNILSDKPAGVSGGKLGRGSQRTTELEAGLSSINHFSLFCVLDAASPGCPVTATSNDLRFVFEIGEEFTLNTAGLDGASMDTVLGYSADGSTIIHLVVYSPLINPNSGRSRFVLASLLDITSFITDAASLPDLETISEESVIEEELQTPPRIHIQQSPSYDVSAENLVGGCFLLKRR